jgi:DnaK suppressor protein
VSNFIVSVKLSLLSLYKAEGLAIFREDRVEKVKMEKFKNLLLQHKIRIMNGGILRSNEDLTVSTDDLSDEADLASSVITQQVTFNMRQRELGKLKAIDEALYRIEEGTYGHCEECEEAIGEKRLENQPWTTLCITHAEEQERENQKFVKAI